MSKKPDPKKQQEQNKSKIPIPVKSVVPKLRGAAPKLGFLRNAAFEELVQIVSKISGKKTLVLDPSMIGSLALVMSLSALKSKGVDDVIRKIDGNPFDTPFENIVFLSRPRMDIMKNIAKQIKAFKQQEKKIYLFMVPRRTLLCEMVLESEGVYNLIEKPIGEFALDVIPFDNDLLSMEMNCAFRELYLEGDLSSSYYIARSIMKLQAIYGSIPVIRYCGPESERISHMITEMRNRARGELANIAPEFAEVILIDRAVDLVTPMMTQLTYEGLIDELYGVNNNLLNLDFLKDTKSTVPPLPPVEGGDAQQQQQQQQAKKPKKMPLNDDDSIFVQIRHKHFLGVGPILKQIAQDIEKVYEERKNLSSDVKKIKEFMTKLPFLTQKHDDLTTHVNIATEIRKETSDPDFRKMVETQQNIIASAPEKQILDYIEDCIIRLDPLPKVLRLLCLHCIVKNGLAAKDYDNMRKELVQSYGHFVLLTLNNLEECGLFFKQGSKKKNINWQRVYSALKLFDQNLDEKAEQQTSIHYVYSGYAPLSVRLIEEARKLDGWKNVSTIIEKDGFPMKEFEQKDATPYNKEKDSKVVLVYFVGGCTFAEISALRFLSEDKSSKPRCRYVVATTKLINGSSLLTSLFENLNSN